MLSIHIVGKCIAYCELSFGLTVLSGAVTSRIGDPHLLRCALDALARRRYAKLDGDLKANPRRDDVSLLRVCVWGSLRVVDDSCDSGLLYVALQGLWDTTCCCMALVVACGPADFLGAGPGCGAGLRGVPGGGPRAVCAASFARRIGTLSG